MIMITIYSVKSLTWELREVVHYFYFLQIEKHKEVAKYWGLIHNWVGSISELLNLMFPICNL